MTRTPYPDPRLHREAPARALRAERREALDPALAEAPAGFDFSLERWLDRLEAGR
jgi:hypothetical protein